MLQRLLILAVSSLVVACAPGEPSPTVAPEGGEAAPAAAERVVPSPPEAVREAVEERARRAAPAVPQERGDDPESGETGEVSFGPWMPCDDDLLARVRRFEVPGGGNLGERIDAGWVAASIDFIDDADTTGAWGCRAAGERAQVAWLSQAYAMHIGPIFWTNTAGTELRPANWLARVLLAADRDAAIATRRPREEVLDRLNACAAPNGRLLTSGVFIGLQRLGRFGTPEAIYGWYVLPGRLEGERVIDRVALQREGSSGPVALEFEVDGERCLPLGAAAERAWRASAGIRAERVALDLSAFGGTFRRDAAPSSASTATQRAVLWVLQRSTELETIEDWITYHSSQRAYDSEGWEVLGPDEARRYRVSHRFSLGNEGYSLDWLVDPDSGAVEPASALVGLARAVQPDTPRSRRLGPREVVLEGSGVDVEVEVREPPTGAEIDALLRERQASVLDCYRFEVGRNRRHRGVSATFEVSAEGRAVNIDVRVDGPESRSFEQCFRGFISGTRFPSFTGEPVAARTSFTFERETSAP